MLANFALFLDIISQSYLGQFLAQMRLLARRWLSVNSIVFLRVDKS
jgi:hypothetical protein